MSIPIFKNQIQYGIKDEKIFKKNICYSISEKQLGGEIPLIYKHLKI